MSKKGKDLTDVQIQDARLTGVIEVALDLNQRLSPFNIQASVMNAAVSLTGTVLTHIDHWLAEEIVRGIDDVNSINNQIQVSNGRNLNKKKDNFFRRWYLDSTTTADVRSKLQWHKAISGSEIDVKTSHGVVTLGGAVDYLANKALAHKIALKCDQVLDVKNLITVY